MSEPKHTPGPWVASPGNAGEWNIDTVGKDGWAIAVVCGDAGMEDPNGRSDANARLIAAAPDLYASCAEFLPILERQLESINPGGAAEASSAYQTAKSRVDRLRAALALSESRP